MKILVAITNYGWKNNNYLKILIDEYKSMSYKVDIVVFSNIPKDFGLDIEVRVGLPIKDPWSLGFPHKTLFAERVKDYDLFIYTEDDTLIKQKNIEAFLDLTKALPDNIIPGFIVYEEKGSIKNFCAFHGPFHWYAKSVKKIGDYTFAFFSNEHTACYMLTQKQLKKAIQSGGYLVDPHKGYYDYLCSAATDPYTQCGFTKMICISHLDNFLLRHLPNVYIGKLGIGLKEFQLQVEALLAINSGIYTSSELIPKTINYELNSSNWDIKYYKRCSEDILATIPKCAQNILSIGCGWGEIESKLAQKGCRVVGVPLDSIIAELAKNRGIEILEPDFKKIKQKLRNDKFDCIMCVDILQHIDNPDQMLSELSSYLVTGGVIVIEVPNFKYIKYIYEISKNRAMWKNTKMHLTTSGMVSRWIKRADLKLIRREYKVTSPKKILTALPLGRLREYVATSLLFLVAK